MRLTEAQRTTIAREVASVLGPDTGVWLFVSRVNDSTRGGDFDLYAEVSSAVPPRLKTRLIARLERQLDNHVDLIIREPGASDSPIFRIARLTGVPLAATGHR